MLTALMPLKNYHAGFLAKALASMFAQDDPDWRLLAIAESGDLPEFERVLGPALADARVALIANARRGLAGAFNTGMREASTDFVAILLADDLWTPDAVAVLNRSIGRHPDVDFFHSSRRIVDEHDQPVSSVYASRESFTLRDFVVTSPVKHLLCWRRALALSIGGMDESLNSVGPDDFDFPWSMADAGARFRGIDECLYVYRDHRSAFRLTTHLPLNHHKREIERIMIKHGAPPDAIEERLAHAQDAYLRQCLYRSRFDRLMKVGRAPDVWREPYE